MRIAIFENIMTPGGHEVDFDRILAEELTALGHEVVFYVPENFVFAMDYGKPVVRLPKAAVTYTNVRGVSRLIATVRRELHRQAWYRALFRHAKQGDFDAIIVPTSTYRYLRALKKSPLRHSPVPIVFILHGINPGEAPKFLRAADALAGSPNIRPTVLTFGDTIFDEETGGTILSTEDLFMHLCHALPEKPRILLAGLEEGVWQDFPQKTKLIGKIHASENEDERFIGGSASTDVTGGMYEKVRLMKELVRKDQALSVSIFSGEQTGNITKELKNIPTGTSIVL